jgi:hypothetical protein
MKGRLDLWMGWRWRMEVDFVRSVSDYHIPI